MEKGGKQKTKNDEKFRTPKGKKNTTKVYSYASTREPNEMKNERCKTEQIENKNKTFLPAMQKFWWQQIL